MVNIAVTFEFSGDHISGSAQKKIQVREGKGISIWVIATDIEKRNICTKKYTNLMVQYLHGHKPRQCVTLFR
jgi:hypothetical protein